MKFSLHRLNFISIAPHHDTKESQNQPNEANHSSIRCCVVFVSLSCQSINLVSRINNHNIIISVINSHRQTLTLLFFLCFFVSFILCFGRHLPVLLFDWSFFFLLLFSKYWIFVPAVIILQLVTVRFNLTVQLVSQKIDIRHLQTTEF